MKWEQYKQEIALRIKEANKVEEERRILHVVEVQRRVTDDCRQQLEDNKFQIDVQRQKAQLIWEREEKDAEKIVNPSHFRRLGSTCIDQWPWSAFERSSMSWIPETSSTPPNERDLPVEKFEDSIEYG